MFILPITNELDFERQLAELLSKHGWEPHVLMNPTEQDLIDNWAAIIYNNNRGVHELGDFPPTPTEMAQIIRQFDELPSPYHRNQLINGGQVSIVRDHPDDHINRGRTVYLNIFNPREINAGKSTYQIVRQPRFETAHPLAGRRRGDLMLLINGMPLIHIELKSSSVHVSQAVNQIKKYLHEGVFSRGIFGLVQVFVAMKPEETLYFANPGTADRMQSAFHFNWADSNNQTARDWHYITANLLSIPMAHQLIGQYTIADDKDQTLKVLRSYQYYAANAICDRVHRTNWDDHAHKGGFVWHTTGSGKTMTSFKAAQLIARSGDADKVVFLLDRIELSTQSADEYRGFANADDNVLDTDSTARLVEVLSSNNRGDALIVTSLQKMARVNPDHNVPQSVIDAIGRKRVVFIVDECHRGVYGDMLMGIKRTFPRALLFGFTGTPVFEDNARNEITTEVIFGDMLHKYTLANGIPDGNVLGFDLTRVNTFQEDDLRRYVATKQCRSLNDGRKPEQADIERSPELQQMWHSVMNQWELLRVEQHAAELYGGDTHHRAVMMNIMEHWPTVSRQGKFHAMLATKSIDEAIEYYRLFKRHYPSFNVAAVFDDSIDNVGDGALNKEDAILEMLTDYNRRFDTSFQQSTYSRYKKDVAKRLAHKPPYGQVPRERQLNLLIVVTQMLTGYDSKWVNALYVDKLMRYVDVIQAFSRTNRLFGPEKPHGIVKYFCRPEQMRLNIDDALLVYVDQPLSVFVDKLEANLEKINRAFLAIEAVFRAEGVNDFSRLPQAEASRRKFAKEFCLMTRLLEGAKMQGFVWDRPAYEFEHSTGWVTLLMALTEEQFAILRQRYLELFDRGQCGGDGDDGEEYELDSFITEVEAGRIDAEYINARFQRYVKYLYTEGRDSLRVQLMQQELTQSFAAMSQRDQRTALLILHDIQRGDLRLSPDKGLMDYVKDYQRSESDRQVMTLCDITGLDAARLSALVAEEVTEQTLHERNRFSDLMQTFDRDRRAEFVHRITGKEVRSLHLTSRTRELVQLFILNPGLRTPLLNAYFNEDQSMVVGNGMVVGSLREPDEAQTSDMGNSTDNIGTSFTPIHASSGSRSKPTTLPDPTTTLPQHLSAEQKVANIAAEVRRELRGVTGWPGTDGAVASFFDMVATPTHPSHDGLVLDFSKAFDELYARRPVNHVDKHVNLGLLLNRFEIYLKKLYWLKHGCDIPRRADDDRHVTLAGAILATPALSTLRTSYSAKCQKLYGYLTNLRQWRNAQEGNGAHGSMYLESDELDTRIHQVVTLYIYVAGMQPAR